MIDDEDRRKIIRAIYDTLVADFGPRFTARFTRGEMKPAAWKFQLLSRLSPFDIQAWPTGFKVALSESRDGFPPEINDIRAAVKARHESMMVKPAPALPKPEQTKVDVLSLLAQAKSRKRMTDEEYAAELDRLDRLVQDAIDRGVV